MIWPSEAVIPPQTCKKIIFVREPNFGFKNVRTFLLEILSKFKVMRVNMRLFLYDYGKLVFMSTWFPQHHSRILTNSLQSFTFWKMSGFFTKNVRELGFRLFACLSLHKGSPNFIWNWNGWVENFEVSRFEVFCSLRKFLGNKNGYILRSLKKRKVLVEICRF